MLKYPGRFMVGSDTWVNQRWMYYEDTMKGYRTWLGDLPADVAKQGGLGQRRGAVWGAAFLETHIVLEELAVPYQRVLVDRAVNAHKSPEYLKLNPNGLIAVLVQDGMAGRGGRAAGAVRDGSHRAAPVRHAPGAGWRRRWARAERAHFYKWLMWLTNTLQATLIVYFYPERWVAQGNAAGAAEVKAAAEAKIAGLLDQLDGELARHGQVWFMGAAYSALDPTSSPCAAGRATSPRCRRVAGRTWALPSAHAGPPGGAARAGGRAAGAALRLTVARGGRITHHASASPGTPARP
jgi:glutathione S-transferase